jgi:hypothetical protein
MTNKNGSFLEIYGTPITQADRFNELFLVLDDLLKRIADTEDPNIRRMRAQVHSELASMRRDASKPHLLTPHSAEENSNQTDPEESWTVSPWGHQALAALAGAAVALSVFRRA